MSHLAPNHQAVELAADDFTTALEAGDVAADAYYASNAGRTTLVGTIALAELADWDGSDEIALVSDPDGIDLLDEEPHDIAA